MVTLASGTLPWAQGAADYLDSQFDLTGVGGWRASARDMGGHPSGRALDLMVGANKAEGDRLASFLIANATAMQVDYIIWQQAIWTTTKPQWIAMENRTGAGDQNHMRHVHVNFKKVIDDRRTFTIPGRSGSASMGSIPEQESPGLVDNFKNNVGGLAEDFAGLTPLGLILNPVTDANSLMANLGAPGLWIRVAQIVGGAILVIGGIAILTKDVAGPAASAVAGALPQGRAVKIALGAAGAGKK